MADSKGRRSLLRKAKKPKISRSETNEAAQDCVICLDKVSCRGKLSVCEHWFCFFCILEWSKNTNTCPVCKMKFRCISKTHLVPGKSPVQKIRVKDVDQRIFQDDNDFIWAELESSMSESDQSNYEPSSHDDPEDESFHIPPEMAVDSDNSNCNPSEDDYFMSWTHEDDSGNSIIDDKDVEEMSFTSIDSGENCSTNIWRRSTRKARVIPSDSEDHSDVEKTDDEWLSSDETTSDIGRETNRRSQRKNTKIKDSKNSGKSRIGAKNGFRRNRQGRQKLPSRRFEAELNRRRATNRKRSEMKRSSIGRAVDSQVGGSAKERYSRTGQWLSTVNSHSPASSRSHDALHRTLRSHTETRSTFHKRESRSTRNDSELTRGDSISKRNNSRSTRNDPRSTRDDLISTRNNSRSTRNYSPSTRHDSMSTRNDSRSTRNYSRPTRNDRRRRRKLCNFERETSSSSSDESWTPLGRSSGIANRRENMIAKKSLKRKRTRSCKVLKEVQNVWDWNEDE